MRYLLDGYNLAHWVANGSGFPDDHDLSAEQLRALLMARLARRRPRDAEAIEIYWDTRTRSGVMPDNEYLDWCSGHYVPVADDAIVDAVAAAAQPGLLVVVSRDREVTGRSRQLGARILSPLDLLGRS